MRLIELEVGTFFWTPRWSENAVGEIVEEPRVEHGLALIHVHCRQLDLRRPSTLRSRLASVGEMERDDWVKIDRPEWANQLSGSGGS